MTNERRFFWMMTTLTLAFPGSLVIFGLLIGGSMSLRQLGGAVAVSLISLFAGFAFALQLTLADDAIRREMRNR